MTRHMECKSASDFSFTEIFGVFSVRNATSDGDSRERISFSVRTLERSLAGFVGEVLDKVLKGRGIVIEGQVHSIMGITVWSSLQLNEISRI